MLGVLRKKDPKFNCHYVLQYGVQRQGSSTLGGKVHQQPSPPPNSFFLFFSSLSDDISNLLFQKHLLGRTGVDEGRGGEQERHSKIVPPLPFKPGLLIWGR